MLSTSPPPTTTQGQFPWRATLRTVIAEVAALLPLLPVIAEQTGIATIPAVAAVLGASAAVTRILADPRMELWLERKLPAIAATPRARELTSAQ